MNISGNNDLFLIVKGKWFKEILNGNKKEEYRLPTKYWNNRIINRNYCNIVFQLGYAKTAKRITVKYLDYELKEITQGMFNEKIKVIALKFGNILNIAITK